MIEGAREIATDQNQVSHIRTKVESSVEEMLGNDAREVELEGTKLSKVLVCMSKDYLSDLEVSAGDRDH